MFVTMAIERKQHWDLTGDFTPVHCTEGNNSPSYRAQTARAELPKAKCFGKRCRAFFRSSASRSRPGTCLVPGRVLRGGYLMIGS